jgi:flagellin FlaB
MIGLTFSVARLGRAGGTRKQSPTIKTANKQKEGNTMNGKFSKAIGNFHRGQKGITGLETAIILIAFVTVAAVLAYSVLSAGIFSSERGKEAVYQGLETAQATMKVTSNVYAQGDTYADNISFQLSSVLQNQNVDLGKCVVNYQDAEVVNMSIICADFDGILSPNEVVDITIDLDEYDLTAYETFTIEIIPPTGATLQIRRTLPGEIEPVMNLY